MLKFKEKTNEFLLKIHWNLNEVKSITKSDEHAKQTTSTGSTVDKLMSTMELTFKSDMEASHEVNSNENQENRKLVWLCDNQQERNDFLDTLWKLAEQFLKVKDRPKFINYQFESISKNF